jgi:hypothetical protein
MSPNAGGGAWDLRGSQPMSTVVHWSPNKFGDLALYLTYAIKVFSTAAANPTARGLVDEI